MSQIETGTSHIARLVSDLIDAVGIRLGKGVPIAPSDGYRNRCPGGRQKIQVAHPDQKILIKTSGDLEGKWDPPVWSKSCQT